MTLTDINKEELKKELVSCLRSEKEIRRIVVFGSFLSSPSPHDLDVAIFQESEEPYLALAMKYRKRTRSVARKIPLDILPLKPGVVTDPFLSEIDNGEVVYER
jgi:predicted nucleotidyltransferase